MFVFLMKTDKKVFSTDLRVFFPTHLLGMPIYPSTYLTTILNNLRPTFLIIHLPTVSIQQTKKSPTHLTFQRTNLRIYPPIPPTHPLTICLPDYLLTLYPSTYHIPTYQPTHSPPTYLSRTYIPTHSPSTSPRTYLLTANLPSTHLPTHRLTTNLSTTYRPAHSLATYLPNIKSFIFQYLGTNGCAKNNGNCPELCLWTGKKVDCACRSGFTFNSETRKCEQNAQFLVYAGSNSMYIVFVLK